MLYGCFRPIVLKNSNSAGYRDHDGEGQLVFSFLAVSRHTVRDSDHVSLVVAYGWSRVGLDILRGALPNVLFCPGAQRQCMFFCIRQGFHDRSKIFNMRFPLARREKSLVRNPSQSRLCPGLEFL